MQRSLEADPQLDENSAFGQYDSDNAQTESSDPDSSDTETDTESPSTSRTAARGNQPRADRLPTTTPAHTATASTSQRATETPVRDDLADVPDELRPHVTDMLALGLLQKSVTEVETQSLQLNQPISRAQYAQWLLAANNRFYEDQPDERIRPGIKSSQPVFEDVPTSHPAFTAIQGLAEAGIIPSPLSGSTTNVNFRPDAPLTRKDLVLWKVPLDTRSALPSATADAIAETWGFQDASKIEPLAQKAVLADYQNGEFANIRRAFGYTTLFQPDKAVTAAEAAAALWRFGSQTEGISAQMLLQANKAK